jgi:hypothetical protein
MTTTTLGSRALNRALLERQLLTTRASLSAEEAVAHLVGMQAQAVNPPYLGLWTRLENFAIKDLSTLLEDRKVVRIALMRSTIHLVTAADCLALRPLLAESLARTVKGQFGRQVDGLDPEEIRELGTALTQEQPLTFSELGKRLLERWPDREPNALAQTVRNLVPLVQIPPRGLWGNTGQAAHTTVSRWLEREVDPDPSVDEYVLRYLDSFGPASVKDMQKWSGLTRLKEAFTRLGSQLRTYRGPDGSTLFDRAERTLPDADEEVPVRFLPEFDNILLSHAQRSHIISDDYRARVFTSNGIIRSTILVDGFVQGRWHIDRIKGDATLVVEPFTALDRKTTAALTEEGQELLRFAAAGAGQRQVRIEPVT